MILKARSRGAKDRVRVLLDKAELQKVPSSEALERATVRIVIDAWAIPVPAVKAREPFPEFSDCEISADDPDNRR